MTQSGREKIIESAKELFGQKGYAATSVRDIAELAELNPALINYHFGSKEELFREVVSTCFQMSTHLINLLKEQPSSLEEFRLTLKLFFKMFVNKRVECPRDYFCVSRNIEIIFELDPDLFKERLWVVVESMQNYIRMAQKKKIIRKDMDDQMMSLMLFSAFDHLTRNESLHCKFTQASTFDETYRETYTTKVISCFIDGVKESP